MAQLMYLMAKEGDKEVLLNVCLDGRGVYNLKPIAIGRESGDICKDAIDILGLNILYP
jgi:hypothetical protein